MALWVQLDHALCPPFPGPPAFHQMHQRPRSRLQRQLSPRLLQRAQPPLPPSSNPLTFVASLPRRILRLAGADPYDDDDGDDEDGNDYDIGASSGRDPAAKRRSLLRVLLATALLVAALAYRRSSARSVAADGEIDRPGMHRRDDVRPRRVRRVVQPGEVEVVVRG